MNMDKETRAFVEAQNKALLEDITGVIRDMGTTMEARLTKEIASVRAEMKGMEKTLKDEISAVALGVLEVKQLARRIDERTQHQVEALYEEVRVTQKEVANIQDHVGLPRSFPVAA